MESNVQNDELMGYYEQIETTPSFLLLHLVQKDHRHHKPRSLIFNFSLYFCITSLLTDITTNCLLFYITFKAIENTVVKLHFIYTVLQFF